MKKWIPLLFLCSPVFANNLTGFWYSDGGIKIARQSFYPPYPGNSNPPCSTCTLTRVWDGKNIKQFSAGNETVGGVLYLLNGGGADATNVMVAVSSMTCPGGQGIVSVSTPAADVWDTTGRPTQIFNVIYSSVSGTSDLPYGHSEYNEKIWPPRFRDVSGSQLWVNRPDHDTYYPIAMVPMELFPSSFTVSQSSSQAIWIDTYISTNVKAGLGTSLYGNCTGQITVTEGVSVSTVIPYYIKVYNFNLPDYHNFPTETDVEGTQIDARFNNGSVDLASRMHFHQLMHAHGFSWEMGDVIDASGNNYPSAEYTTYLNGSAFTKANGYGNARGVGVGHSGYMIGTYRSWRGSPYTDFSDTDSNQFCTTISSWSLNLGAYSGILAALYLEDEASSTTIVNSNEKWATWLTTSCTMSGALIHSWETAPAPTAATYSPHVNVSVSASVFGHDPNHNYPNETNFAYTPTTWQTVMNGYLTAGTTQGWRYNDQAFGSGAFPKPEEEGYVPRMNFWADWLKLCAPSPSPGVCKGGHMEWQSNYWNDENNAHNNNVFPQMIKTFGYNTTQSAQWGANGFNYTQMDGVLAWPGTDDIDSNNSYGVKASFATWPLKMYRRGVDDADIMTMAAAINLNTTTTTVRGLISQALWEVPCTQLLAPADCSYNNTTDRTWSYDPNAYTTNIETLYNIVAGGIILPSTNKVLTRSGTAYGGGTIQ